MSYFPIQALSAYSLLKSPTTPTALVKHAKKLGYESIALTDYDTLYGMVEFYNAAKKADIKPIIGLTLKVNGLINQNTISPLILLARNEIGYHNLLKISSYKMTLETPSMANLLDIKEFLSNLVIINPIEGELNQLVLQGQSQLAIELITRQQQLFDAGSCFLGINLEQTKIQREAVQLFSEENNMPLVIDERVDYLEPSDYFASRVMQAIDANIILSNLGQLRNEIGQHHLKPIDEIQASYLNAGLADALANNQHIATLIDFELKFKQPQLPAFPLPDDINTATYLAMIAQKGLDAKGLTTAKYVDRLNHELKVINDLGFNDYFLIVWDVIQWAHKQKIQTGPGRGSAAGSLVAYALEITDVDPIAYDLLFERFLNPARAQMPDIDLDLPDNRREEVLNYVHSKYGHTHVAQIITFGTLATKQVMRDTGRVFGYTQPQLSRLAKVLSGNSNHSLSELAQMPALQNTLADLPNGELLLQVAQKIEGLPRNYSTHAAGIVISQESLTNIVPVQLGPDRRLMTQLPKNPVEALGLLKMDFLGLRNLSLLATILAAVQAKLPDFTLDQINLEDEMTLKLFQAGQTNGIFQFESNGIKQVLRELKPDSFEMVAAVNALYRPGPMENIKHFIARKHGEEPIEYPDKILEPILAPTFGIIVYQEQVMRVASTLAGFTLAEADMLRRAISKKDANKISVLRQKFIDGAIQLGHQTVIATKVYDYIEAFADYGFNRSHAVAYSKMAFQLAYFKVHYPSEFYMALINANLGSDEKLALYIQELRQAGVPVVGPDINRSQREFSLSDGALRFGLGVIKGLRSDFVSALITIRDEKGPFTSLPNLIGRIDDKWRKENLLLPLIQAGACDSFEYNRHELIEALGGVLEAVGLSGSSVSLFATMAPKIMHRPDYSLIDKLKMEAQVLGAYVSAHPVEQYRNLRQGLLAVTLNQLIPNQQVKVIGLLISSRIIRTKTGQEMAFLTIADETGEKSVTIFPRLYARIKNSLQRQQIYVFSGMVEQGREIQLVADQVTLVQEYKLKSNKNIIKNTEKQWFLRISKEKNIQETEAKLQSILQKNKGDFAVILVYELNNRKILLPKEWSLQKNNSVMVSLTSLLGRENVFFK